VTPGVNRKIGVVSSITRGKMKKMADCVVCNYPMVHVANGYLVDLKEDGSTEAKVVTCDANAVIAFGSKHNVRKLNGEDAVIYFKKQLQRHMVK
jgi:hypothetical protein